MLRICGVQKLRGGDQSAPGERERLLGDEDIGTDWKEKKSSSLYQLLVDQLEFANVILLNKVDLVHPKDPVARHKLVMQVGRLVRKFNPDAKILVPGYEFEFNESKPTPSVDKPVRGKLTVDKFQDFDVNQIINTRLFDMQKAQMSAGWIRELQLLYSGVAHNPETEEYGVGSFVFRTNFEDPRPFHPMRLKSILKGFGHLITEKEEDMPEGPFAGVVRSKGQLWLANCNAVQIDFHSAGRQVSLGSGMPFLAAMPRKYWDANSWKQYLEYAKQGYWHGTLQDGFGDRTSALVIIGVELSAKRKQMITDALNSALLTDDEMAAGKAAFEKKEVNHPWKSFKDPFFGGNVKELFEVSVEKLEGVAGDEGHGHKH